MSVRPISKELQAKACEELHEEVKRIPDDIKYIKAWLKQQKHITARTDDQWLLSFLRGCKFSLERSKEKLDMFYTIRTMIPEIFSNRDPMLPEIQELLDVGTYLPLPKTKDPDSPRIVLIRSGCYDAHKVNPMILAKTQYMIQDILLNEDDNFVVAGITLFQDMKGISLQHMTAMTPTMLKKGMKIFQEAYPIRPKAFHFINIPSFFEAIYAVIKPLLNQKMMDRMVIHEGKEYNDLYKDIPKSILPKEYGGDGPTIAELTADCKKKVESYRDWFIEDAKYGVDEKKRPGKPKTSDEMFGVEGSFRALSLD